MIFNSAFSQDLDPRAYANMPKDGNVIVASYGFMKGDVVSEANVPIEDFIISSNNFGVGYMHTFGLADRLARVQVVLPYVFMDGHATIGEERITGNRNGFGDMRVRLGINLFGSKALSIKEFSQYKQKTIFGASLVTLIPTGVYYSDKRVNIGANRWGFKPEVGVSKRFKYFYAELYSGVWFYTPNHNYLGDDTLKQNPVFNFQGHVSYYFKNQMWISVNGTWFSGGKTEVDDLPAGSLINNSRIGFTWAVPFTKSQSVKLQLNTGVFKDIGLNYDAITLSYQFVFF
ncbi:transporter [Flavobacterium adhaerens]|uniref:transporter n=1 Tax=Flavobacterium adhaerens TaxID=3149043 RepID=UPI0032B5E5BF